MDKDFELMDYMSIQFNDLVNFPFADNENFINIVLYIDILFC